MPKANESRKTCSRHANQNHCRTKPSDASSAPFSKPPAPPCATRSRHYATRRAHAFVAHADLLLHQFDQLHKFRNRIHAQQRQKKKPFIKFIRFFRFAAHRIIIKRHRLLRERIHQTRNPSDRTRAHAFDNRVVHATNNRTARCKSLSTPSRAAHPRSIPSPLLNSNAVPRAL